MRRAPIYAGPALMRTVDLVVHVVDRAVLQPVRAGRLRSQAWPHGLRVIVGTVLTVYGLLVVAAVAGAWIRRVLPGGSSFFGIAPELLGPATAVTALLAAAVVTAGMHAPVALRIGGLLAPLLLWSSQLWLADDPAQLLWAAAGLVALVLFQVLRAGRGFAWWELAVTLTMVAAVTAVNLATVVAPAVDSGGIDASLQVMLTVVSVGVLGLGYTVTSGAAVAELALGTSAWFVEHLSRRFGPRTQVVTVLVIAAVAWGAMLLRMGGHVVPPTLLLAGLAVAVVLLVVMLLCWLLLDRAIDAREARSGAVPGSTDLADLAESFRPLAIAVGLALATPQALNIVWGNLERGLRLPLSALGVDYLPTDMVGRLTHGTTGTLVFTTAGEAIAVLVCAVVAFGAVRRRQRGRAELALVVGLFCLITGIDHWSVPFVRADLDTLAAATLIIVTAVGGYWTMRRRLTYARLHAVAVGLLLAGAISARDLLADPLGWLLGSASGALLVIGLVWNLLTNADDANGHSQRFPRAARTLVVVGYLTVAMLVVATDSIAVTFAIDLERFVLLGGEVIGTGLLATALWAVLATGARNAPTVEPGAGR